MSQDPSIRSLLERLAGQQAPFPGPPPEQAPKVFRNPNEQLGYSQLNELLLLFGFDRITHAFFGFLRDGSTEYQHGDGFSSIQMLEVGIERFRKTALLLYGNVKFAFKSLSRDADLLESALRGLEPIADQEFTSRHEAIQPLDPIPPGDAYLTGYLIERELARRLEMDPSDEEAKKVENKRLDVVKKAKRNHEAYLASDHLDVYVATSMRERHDFASVNRLAREIFEHDEVAPLKLRWFDPTQAYCRDRIDKGLSEALMLRRATCTIYLAQESDTFGKDSELASTLAQGKPVVAYVPSPDSDYVDSYLKRLSEAQPMLDDTQLMLDQLKIFEPDGAWSDAQVRGWLESPETTNIEALRTRLESRIVSHYKKRAETLRESHPLGIQVNLETGVANGVLVVRSVADCAKLVRRIVTHTMQMELVEGDGYTALRETISDCIFRVMTGDAMLTNTFWNFYVDPAE